MIALLFIASTSGCTREEYPRVAVDPSLLRAYTETFVPHTGDGQFDSYLAMNLPYRPASQVLSEVEVLFGVKLKSRGEAHITVITPIEYQRLAPTLSMRAINELASPQIQHVPFEILCLGRATAMLPSGLESTFFLVVRAPRLLELRRRIRDEFARAGGEPGAFDPETYFPHVTLGFTSRDLHERDGVVKDESACVARIRLAEQRL